MPPRFRPLQLAPPVSYIAHALISTFTALALAGCATTPHRSTRPVSIDSRPTPPQPAAAPKPVAVRAPGAARTAPAPAAVTPPRPRFEADTLAARAAVTRCNKRRLLPEQESTLDSARQLLFDARMAALQGDQPRAVALAREARQLTLSLNYP